MAIDFDPATRGFTDSPELRSLVEPYAEERGRLIYLRSMPAEVAALLLDFMPEWNKDVEMEAPTPRELIAIAGEIEGSVLDGHIVTSERDDERITLTSITVPGSAANQLRERLGWWAEAAFDPDTAFEPGEIPEPAVPKPDDDLTLWWD